MADIRPFLCIRPREDEAAEIAALPYDVYNREEAKKAVEGHDKSFLRIDRAETQFDDSVDTYACLLYTSDNVKAGMQQAPHRSLFNALGFTEEEMKKPMVGIVSSYNEIVPGHMNLDKIVNAVKLGVAEAGGVPVVFPAIAVCDGIAMGHIGIDVYKRQIVNNQRKMRLIIYGCIL